MPGTITVALPVRDGGPLLLEVLDAVLGQRVDADVELLVADSRSRDGSAAAARARGGRVIDVPPGTFSHGGTRNALMREARGDRVAFLTQDATPADDRWLASLTAALDVDGVGLACGPYLPRPGAKVPLRRELEDFFASVGRWPNGDPHAVRLLPAVAQGTAGPGAFHTDANAVVARWAWERAPFREVAYAEDQLLARDMARAGVVRAFVPDAAVLHSHDLTPGARFRRWFDEFRALREVHGTRVDAHPRRALGDLRTQVRRDRAYALARARAQTRQASATGTGSPDRDDPDPTVGGARLVAASLAYHGERRLAGVLGSRADALPPALRRALSAEGRAAFSPAAHDPGAP